MTTSEISALCMRPTRLCSTLVRSSIRLYQSHPAIRLLRFMDWMCTNDSMQSTWTGRPAPGNAFWSTKGVPVEIMVSLLNKVHADGWFNMPAMATDDYITRFASYVHNHLDPDQKVYVEYSNEAWYDRFPQSSYITNMGKAAFPGYSSPTQANRNYYGMRTAQMCRSWKDTWGTDANRVICVLATEARDVVNTQVALDCSLWPDGPCGKNYGIDAIAIGPYFGYPVPDSWTDDPDAALQGCSRRSIKAVPIPTGPVDIQQA